MTLRWLLAVLAAAACGTPPPSWTPDAGACMAYVVPTGTDLMTPSVSFKTDVMKVFNNNCGTSLCHGSTSEPTGGLFLGASTAMGSDSVMAFDALVGKPSNELTAMPLVTPSNPNESYLMHKLDGDQCQYTSMCSNDNCQNTMPSGVTVVLPVSERDTVRRWIAQGATNE
jgi:hypothetical protein